MTLNNNKIKEALTTDSEEEKIGICISIGITHEMQERVVS